jgi:phospholipase/carboxylesterase
MGVAGARADRRSAAPCYSGRVSLASRARWRVLLRLAGASVLAGLLVACGSAPPLAAAVRARATGFEPHEGATPSAGQATPRWSRWGRAGALRFLEVVIGTDEVERALPLVVALHGYGDAPRVPDGPYLGRARAYRIVLPEGPVAVEAGHAWSALRVRDDRPAALASDLSARAEEVAALAQVLRAARPTRGRPILVGFSQGGHLALATALRHPDAFSTVIPMAAWIPPGLEPTRPPSSRTPLRALHARDDERVPFASSEALYQRLAALGWDVRLDIVDGGHAPSTATEAFVARELDRALVAVDP